MSRVGKMPIKIPQGVDFKLDGGLAWVEGPKGHLEQNVHPNMKIEMDAGEVRVVRPNDQRQNRALHGLTRSLLNNMVIGVTEGFSKTLLIVGVGYKVDLEGKNLVLQLGYSHPVNYPAPDGIQFEIDSKQNKVVVKGINKQQVGQVAAEIRELRPPEPYKGKGVRYKDERIRRKSGKAAVGAGD